MDFNQAFGQDEEEEEDDDDGHSDDSHAYYEDDDVPMVEARWGNERGKYPYGIVWDCEKPLEDVELW